MKHVSHYEKVMWRLYCEYSYLKQEVYKHTSLWTGRSEWRVRTSKENWDWIHSKYYYVTKIDPIYSGSAEDFRKYMEYRTYRCGYRCSPYDYKKNGYSWAYGRQCGKNLFNWNYTRGVRTKDQKKPEHIKKKKLSEDEVRRREWRNKKKDQRDQGSRFYSGNHKKVALRLGNRRERRHVKQKLNKSDFKYWSKSSTFWDVKHCIGHDYNGECIKEIFEWNPPKDDWDNYYDDPKRKWVDSYDWN